VKQFTKFDLTQITIVINLIITHGVEKLKNPKFIDTLEVELRKNDLVSDEYKYEIIECVELLSILNNSEIINFIKVYG